MTDLSYFDAQMQEQGAEPAHLFTGPDKSPVMVIVRAFADDEAIRLTIEDRSGEINQQLLINRNALGHLADDPEEISQVQRTASGSARPARSASRSRTPTPRSASRSSWARSTDPGAGT